MRKKQTIAEIKKEGKVTTADKVPVPEKPKVSEIPLLGKEDILFDADRINQQVARLKVLEEIEEYCSNSGCFPKDLIDAHRNLNKPQIKGKTGIAGKLPVPVKPSLSNWRQDYIKAKTGQK